VVGDPEPRGWRGTCTLRRNSVKATQEKFFDVGTKVVFRSVCEGSSRTGQTAEVVEHSDFTDEWGVVHMIRFADNHEIGVSPKELTLAPEK
jgi:hypothetical protein